MMKVSLLVLLQLAAAAVAYSPLSPPVQQTTTRASTSSSAGETSRRNLLASVALGTSALLIDPSKAFAAAAAADTSSSNLLVEFKDVARKFSVKVPSDWDKTIQELPDRRKITLYIKPNSNQKTLMFFAYTPVRDDFTSLGSFGSVDQVSWSLVWLEEAQEHQDNNTAARPKELLAWFPPIMMKMDLTFFFLLLIWYRLHK